MKLKLSATNQMVPGNTLTEKAEVLSKLGYSGMAVFIDGPDWKDEYLTEMQGLEAKTGVKVCEFVLTADLYGRLMDPDPKVRDAALPYYLRSIEIANKLGAITEFEYEYRAQDPLPLFDPYKTMPKEEEERFIGIANKLGRACEDGAYMLLEACNRYETKYLTTMEACTDVLKKTAPDAAKHLGLIADFFHLALEENDLRECVLYAGDWIKHVHLGDHNRLQPGYGHTDWKTVFRALNEIGFDGYMNLECGLIGEKIDALTEVHDYLKGIADSI